MTYWEKLGLRRQKIGYKRQGRGELWAEISGLSRESATRQLLSVRFGSKADICSAKGHVRFTPESGHVQSDQGCPLRERCKDETALHYCCRYGFDSRIKHGYGGTETTVFI